jgi:hypothetical protein
MVPVAGLPDFRWYNIPKYENIYQMDFKIPNDHKTYQMVLNIPNVLTNISNGLPNIPNVLTNIPNGLTHMPNCLTNIPSVLKIYQLFHSKAFYNKGSKIGILE